MNGRRLIGLGATAAAALLAVAAIAGCGSSSSSSSSSSTAAITKTAFLAKANALCKKGNATSQAARKQLGSKPTHVQIVSYTKGQIGIIQTQITSVKALGPPAGDQAKVSGMLAMAQADLDKIKANPALLASNTDYFANFAKVAHPYGLTACAPNS